MASMEYRSQKEVVPDMADHVLQRILFVEDDPDIRSVVRLTLERLGGFTVQLCESGEEALREAPLFRPDLLLLDVMMPGMDGTATLAALREIPETRNSPAVFLTAAINLLDISDFQELGLAGVIAKPFDPSRLCPTLHHAWGAYHDRAAPPAESHLI